MKRFAFLLLVLTSCTAGVELKEVEYDYLMNDGNSKVWMIDQMIVKNSNIASPFDSEKELLIFYQSGRFQYIPVKQLGHQNGKVGNYVLFSKEKELKLYFKKKLWHFAMTEISEDAITLVPVENSDEQFTLKLIPLKELFQVN
ncbi:MAG: hypothetical protein HWE22_04195 [Flavobacteriales bacterium]|nr:hypothetical protein [Flavobacteriales bacterium]PIE86737.1 MAG: hypothetical protein CSA03_03620 [Bacteroidota bacterium]